MKAGDFKVGQWVGYESYPGARKEQGRVKGIPDPEDEWVFVVFHCADEWDNYQNYTGQRTNIKQLSNFYNGSAI